MSIKNQLTQLTKNKTTDFRFIPFIVVLFYILTLFFSEFYFGSYAVVGKHFALHPQPYFVDLKILLCGIDAIRDNINPYEINCDNTIPYFNYPITWGFLAPLPFITVPNVLYIGICLALCFFTSLYFFIGKINFLEAIIYSFLFISPAVMLGPERGNSDLIIFLLLLIPILKTAFQRLFPIIILFCSLLKLFPIAAIMGIFHRARNNTKNALIIFLSVGLMFLFYIILMRDNILMVSKKTPRPYRDFSYGLGGIPSIFIDHFPSEKTSIYILLPVLMILGFFLFHILTIKQWRTLKFSEDKYGLSYIAGSSIFVTTCLIGHNWEYRLIFLLFAIPQILKWILEKKQFAFLLLILVMLILWQSFIGNILSKLPLNVHYSLISQLFVVILFYCLLSILLNFTKETLNKVQPLFFTKKNHEVKYSNTSI
ncbi:MAG: hypothetical protein WKF91_08915 [Segetibacter sp.]